MEFISKSEEETELLGKMLGAAFRRNTVVCLEGELGAGKTTFIKGMAAEVTGIAGIEISSPTFTYLNIYEGKETVYHFDLYRLKEASEFLSMGFDEYFEGNGICCIEWSEKIREIIPHAAIRIHMEHAREGVRRITMSD